MSLTFQQLREANLKRLPVFKNSKGEPAHSKPDGSDWTTAQWLQAVIGEIGEYANIRKKFERGDIGQWAFDDEAGKELADIQIYLDILSYQCGIDFNNSGFSGFQDLRDFTWSDKYYCDPPEQCLINLMAPIANIGSSVLAYSTSEYNELMESVMGSNFKDLQIRLDALAASLNIGLDEATREKFNAVSDRIGCNIYI